MKISKTSPYARAAHTKLSNQMFIKLATPQSIRQLLAEFIAHTSDTEFDEKFTKLLKSPKIRKVINVFTNNIDDFSRSGFRAGAPVHRILQMYKHLIDANKSTINQFVASRDRIEHLIVIGDYAGAGLELSQIEQKFGESVWQVRTKMLILSSTNDNEAFKEFCDTTKTRGEGSLNAFIFKASQLIIDAGNATSQLAAVVHRQIAEFKEAKHEVLASFLQILFNPYPVEPEIDHLSCLEYLQTYPIIDLYTILLRVLMVEFANYDGPSYLNQDLRRLAKEVSDSIDDPILKKIIDIEKVVTNGPLQLAGNSLSVYTKYKSGDYRSALADYLLCMRADDSAVSLANLAGKSLAYLDEQIVIAGEGSVLENLAKDLSTIYRLSPLWSQAEDQITSACVKYNHLSISSCLQLSLLKSLPLRYTRKQQKVAARLAIASTARATPQAFVMANDKDLVFDNIGLSVEVPHHRRIKEQLMKMLSSDDINVDEANNLLAALLDSEALHKDILECQVALYLKLRNNTELIRLASEELTSDSNYHISLPMEYLVDLIEKEQLADLDAVIVCYHYNLSISDKKDSLLNETFEEYLMSTGVTMPSQLLAKVGQPDKKQQFFFREICIPDIIDYLGCFKGSNGLRSERITILNQLQELGVIDPKDRMREVEDIVRQVIVDTGTSEFNSAKIFVNEAIIRRKHLDEISSMIEIYKKAPIESEDRYTPNDQNPAAGVR